MIRLLASIFSAYGRWLQRIFIILIVKKYVQLGGNHAQTKNLFTFSLPIYAYFCGAIDQFSMHITIKIRWSCADVTSSDFEKNGMNQIRRNAQNDQR